MAVILQNDPKVIIEFNILTKVASVIM